MFPNRTGKTKKYTEEKENGKKCKGIQHAYKNKSVICMPRKVTVGKLL